MKDFTAEQLVNAIRNAGELSELKHMVGASEEENKKSEQRIARIDAIGSKYGYRTDDMPWSVANEYKNLMAEQDRFESDYC